MKQEGIAWSDPWLKAQDLEFHHLDPHRNLGWAVARTPPEWEMTATELQMALREAPANTRAHARSRIMRLLKDRHIRYFVDWEVVDAEGGNSLPLLNPFDAEPPELEPWARQLNLL